MISGQITPCIRPGSTTKLLISKQWRCAMFQNQHPWSVSNLSACPKLVSSTFSSITSVQVRFANVSFAFGFILNHGVKCLLLVFPKVHVRKSQNFVPCAAANIVLFCFHIRCLKKWIYSEKKLAPQCFQSLFRAIVWVSILRHV